MKNKILFITIFLCTMVATFLFSVSKNNQNKKLLTSRFILTSDENIDKIANFSLPKTWWSRPFEYAWAANFANSKVIALDAACGISHPFKWFLGSICKKTWACDTDIRLGSDHLLVQETLDDLGRENYNTLLNNPNLRKNVNLVVRSICNLPESMPLFDRIFCISTLEHMSPNDRTKAFSEFAKKLSPKGLVVITMDYPLVQVEKLFSDAEKAGLVPAGKVEFGNPPENAIYSDTAIPNARLYVYRAVFKHKNV